MTVPGLDDAIGEALSAIDQPPAAPASVPQLAQRRRPAPFVLALRLGDLFTDRTYQRPLDALRVARMVDAFDPALVGVLEVSERTLNTAGDGGYALIDGQHRWAVLIEAHPDHEDAHVPCNVHRGLTVTEEAQLFYEMNSSRRALTNFDKWVARRIGGDPIVLGIDEVLARHGIVVWKATDDARISATGALQTIVALGGHELLDRVLALSTGVYGTGRAALDGSLLGGLAEFLAAYDASEFDATRLGDVLRSMTARELRAKSIVMRDQMVGLMPRLVAAVLIDEYNRRPGAKLQRFPDRVPPQSKANTTMDPAQRRRHAIRLWARRNGYHVNDKGWVPKAVIAAYDAAHAEVAS